MGDNPVEVRVLFGAFAIPLLLGGFGPEQGVLRGGLRGRVVTLGKRSGPLGPLSRARLGPVSVPVVSLLTGSHGDLCRSLDRPSRADRNACYGRNDDRCQGASLPTDPDDLELLTPGEAMALLRVSRSWLCAAANDGRLPSIRLGGPDGPLCFVKGDLVAQTERARAAWRPGRQRGADVAARRAARRGSSPRAPRRPARPAARSTRARWRTAAPSSTCATAPPTASQSRSAAFASRVTPSGAQRAVRRRRPRRACQVAPDVRRVLRPVVGRAPPAPRCPRRPRRAGCRRGTGRCRRRLVRLVPVAVLVGVLAPLEAPVDGDLAALGQVLSAVPGDRAERRAPAGAAGARGGV